MLKYKGSGTKWTRHIKKHDSQFVTTLWYELYNNPFDLVADALSMSREFDIVNNDLWMNQINEIGIMSNTLSDIMRKKNPIVIFQKIKNPNPLPKDLYLIHNSIGDERAIDTLSKLCKIYGNHIQQLKYNINRKTNDGWTLICIINFPYIY